MRAFCFLSLDFLARPVGQFHRNDPVVLDAPLTCTICRTASAHFCTGGALNIEPTSANGSRSMNYFFWLLLNIGVPVFGPIFFLTLAAVSYGKAAAREMILESVKDGQMYWTAIAVSTAGIYESWTLASQNLPISKLVLLTCAFVAIVSSILVTLAEVKAYSIRQMKAAETARHLWTTSNFSGQEPSVSSGPTLVISFVLTTLAAIALAYAHATAA
jgi:hypothetical protein